MLSRCLHRGAKRERSNSSYSFLTSTLDGSSQRHAPAVTHWVGGVVGLLNMLKRFCAKVTGRGVYHQCVEVNGYIQAFVFLHFLTFSFVV
jgi:hypothetical protein